MLIALATENEKLFTLKEKFEQYSELLDAFKFEKMKYMRAQDKFEAAIRAYEEVEQQDDADVKAIEAEYLKWKEMAARNFDRCNEVKAKGEVVLKEVETLRRELDVRVGAQQMLEYLEARILDNNKKIEDLRCEK